MLTDLQTSPLLRSNKSRLSYYFLESQPQYSECLGRLLHIQTYQQTRKQIIVIHADFAEVDAAIDQVKHRSHKRRSILDTALVRDKDCVPVAETTAYNTNGREQQTQHLPAEVLACSTLRPVACRGRSIDLDCNTSVAPQNDRHVAKVIRARGLSQDGSQLFHDSSHPDPVYGLEDQVAITKSKPSLQKGIQHLKISQVEQNISTLTHEVFWHRRRVDRRVQNISCLRYIKTSVDLIEHGGEARTAHITHLV